jgi:hypothetical protein
MRLNDGGPDPLSNGGNTWHFKTDGIYAGSTSGMSLQEVKALIEPIQPDRVVTAGGAYERASAKLTELASNLIDHAQKLAGAWGGATAPKAIAQMQQLHETAVELANTSQGTASVLKWYGSTIQPWYKSQILNMNDTLGDKLTGFFTGTDPANTAAANQLAKLNARTVEAYNSIPPAANKNLPPLTGSYGAPGGGVSGSASGGARGSGTSTVPISGGSGTGGGGVVGGGPGPGGPGGPVIGTGPGKLSGTGPMPHPGAPGGRLPGGGLGPGGPGGGPIITGPVIGGRSPGALGGEPVPGEQVPGEPVPGEPVVGGGDPVVGEPVIGRGVGVLGGDSSAAEDQVLAESPAGSGIPAGEAAAGEGLAAGDAEAIGGPGFMPVGGAGQGSEREHSTWLTEDRDVWNGGDEVTPPVIS